MVPLKPAGRYDTSLIMAILADMKAIHTNDYHTGHLSHRPSLITAILDGMRVIHKSLIPAKWRAAEIGSTSYKVDKLQGRQTKSSPISIYCKTTRTNSQLRYELLILLHITHMATGFQLSQESNSGPLGHESSALTARPGH